MPEHFPGLPYLRETLIFLALAGILIPLLQRLRINQNPRVSGGGCSAGSVRALVVGGPIALA